MSVVTRQATANQSPDPGQGGSAVTGAANTGHDSTTVSTVGLDDQFATCLWSGFAAAPAEQIFSTVLKFDWSENGSNSGGGVNVFKVQYSLNGGSSWTDAINHTPITGANNGSTSISLSASQDLTQVQVRDFIEASSPDGGTSSVTASVSNIKLEVVVVDAQVIVIE